ncbi:MAG: 7-carboxy-7-deazaguanine synthase [Bacteroidota bacterium]
MAYAVKEIFYSLQGEGLHTGRPAVFLRFSGCNLWSGREVDRAQAICQFCDTDFFGTDGACGGKYKDATALAAQVNALWPEAEAGQSRYVVCSGGEPLLQLDVALIDALKSANFEVAVETNGTLPAPEGIDWICVSPKAGTTTVQTTGNELKLVYPQPEAMPEAYADLDFDHFFLQPMDGPDVAVNTQQALAYCLRNPHWRLSLQSHKLLQIP